jgi:hypothetical protein
MRKSNYHTRKCLEVNQGLTASGVYKNSDEDQLLAHSQPQQLGLLESTFSV